MAYDVRLFIASNCLRSVNSAQLKPLAKIGVTALAVTILSAPTLACLWPGSTLTASEHECCRRMAECGLVKKVSSHRCCTTTVRQDNVPIVHKAPSFAPRLSVTAGVPQSPSTAPTPVDAAAQHTLASHSPPELYFAFTQVLRI